MKSKNILILHGWGLTGYHYAKLAREFKKRGIHVFHPDLPGFGKNSTLDRPYSLDDYVTFVKHYIDIHGIKDPIIIGHSFGGRISIKYASQNPKEVRGIILTGTPGFSPIGGIKRAIFSIFAKSGNMIFQTPILQPLRRNAQKFLYLIAGAKDFYRAQDFMPETFKKIVAEDLSGYMGQLSLPVLLVWGEHDILVPLSVAKRMNRAISGSELLVITGDHCVSYRKPFEFVSAILPFIHHLWES